MNSPRNEKAAPAKAAHEINLTREKDTPRRVFVNGTPTRRRESLIAHRWVRLRTILKGKP
jgi:hypothetical protein